MRTTPRQSLTSLPSPGPASPCTCPPGVRPLRERRPWLDRVIAERCVGTGHLPARPCPARLFCHARTRTLIFAPRRVSPLSVHATARQLITTLLPRNPRVSGGGQGGRLSPLARPFELAIKAYRACQRCLLAFGFKAFSRQAVRHRGKKIRGWDWVDKIAIGTGCDWAGVCQEVGAIECKGVGNFPGRHQGLDGSYRGLGIRQPNMK